METNELVDRYYEINGHGHASRRAAAATVKVCYVPKPAGLADEADDEGAVSARDDAEVCYVP